MLAHLSAMTKKKISESDITNHLQFFYELSLYNVFVSVSGRMPRSNLLCVDADRCRNNWWNCQHYSDVASDKRSNSRHHHHRCRSVPNLHQHSNTKTRNLSSHSACSPMPAAVVQWPQQPCDRDSFRNQVTLMFDLLTSGSMHSEQMPNLVFIAQAVFLLECTQRQTCTQTHRCHWWPIPHISYAGMG